MMQLIAHSEGLGLHVKLSPDTSYEMQMQPAGFLRTTR